MPLNLDPATQCAFSICENKGVFALLLGSGISRAASIPTGWEITLDLVRRVALARGVDAQPDWAAWYRAETGENPNYSDLLEELGASPDERRAIIHRYIEPTAEDREQNKKVPTEAHRSIAKIVAAGHIRVIVTTNFDRLVETALRELGVEPTVITSMDVLRGAEPLTHSACYVLKLHGDYKDARILNTEAELSGYPAEYDALLDRIFDEFGLIICGWSGEWDHALKAAMMRAPNRRYSVFWAARGAIGTAADELIRHRRARIIPIDSADTFISKLGAQVEALEASQRENPLSIDLLIASAKRFLSKPEHRIQLDELFSDQTNRLLKELDGPDFAVSHQWAPDVFRRRVIRYEATTEALARMLGVIGRWGPDEHHTLVVEIIRSLVRHANLERNGINGYVNLRAYPAILAWTAYGLGLVRSSRLAKLHDLFVSSVERPFQQEPKRAVEQLYIWEGAEEGIWREIEGARYHSAFSHHLIGLFSGWSDSFIGLTSSFPAAIATFETLASLSVFERESLATAQAALASESFSWMPIGHTTFDNSSMRPLLAELVTTEGKQKLIDAGFAHGNPDFIDLFLQNRGRVVGRMQFGG